MSSLARALSQLTERSLRPGSDRDFSIGPSPHPAAFEDCGRSEPPRSGDVCETRNADPRSAIGYSEIRNSAGSASQAVHAPQLSQAIDCGEPIGQPALDSCKSPLESQLSEHENGLGRPGFAIVVLIATIGLMAAPGLIAGMAIVSRSFGLNHESAKQAIDIGSIVTAAGLLVGVALVVMVRQAPREQ